MGEASTMFDDVLVEASQVGFPFRAAFRLYTSQGVEVVFTIEDVTMNGVVAKVEAAQVILLEKGYKTAPTPKFTAPAAPKPAAKDNGDRPAKTWIRRKDAEYNEDGLPICPLHKVPMEPRGSVHMCPIKENGEYCQYAVGKY